MAGIYIPDINYSFIKKCSIDFLKLYHPSSTIPIPIDEIVELDMSIKLLSVPDLKSTFNIDGFINSSFDEIVIDDWVFNCCEERARFTIAHEIGHKILHEKIYRNANICNIEEYIDFQNNIPAKDYQKLESQASKFAGCILVPSEILAEKVNLLKKQTISKNGYSYLTFESLPSSFKVSEHVLLIQLEKEGIPIKEIY